MAMFGRTLKENSFLQSLKGKIIAAFVLGLAAFFLFWLLVQFTFNKVLTTVETFTYPNEKLRIVNQLYEDISKLDYTQRTLAIQQQGRPFRTFLKESQNILLSIDTLKSLNSSNHSQMSMLDSMEIIVHKRDKLLLSYLNARSDLINNKEVSKKIQYISELLSKNTANDSNIITTNRTLTTTTLVETDSHINQKKNWLSRLLSGKRKDATSRQTLIKKELDISTDTLSIAVQDSIIRMVEEMMLSMEEDRFKQSISVLNKELALAKSNYRLVNQLLKILKEMEAEELDKIKLTNQVAGEQVSESIGRIQVIMLLFFFGAAALVFFIFSDISRSNKYRLQLIEAKNEAERLGHVKQQFLANMSHEIRTPLQSIIGYSELVKDKAHPDKKALDAIHTSSGHLLQIVNEILDYSRISSGKFSFESEPFDLKKTIDEVMEVMRLQADEKQLELIKPQGLEKPFWVKGDSFRLKQVLFNLLGNAIKFTEKGSVSLALKHHISRNIAYCRFTIEDTGKGIEARHLERIFDSFEQENSEVTQNYSGTGLGLAIVKTLVESQAGEVAVQSEPGKGTRFMISLPFPCAAGPPEERFQLKPPGAFNGKVMVVDDDKLILQLCEMIFSAYGIDHVLYNDPVKAKNTTWDNSVTHVFLDIRMPGINGFELCRHIRNVSSGPLSIFALTAQVLPGEKDKLQQQGFDSILTKPFSEKQLLEKLHIKSSTTNSLATIDLRDLEKMTSGNKELLSGFLKSYHTETGNDLLEMKEAIKKSNMPGIREILHKLAGRTGQAGATELSLMLRNAEMQVAASGRMQPGELEKIMGQVREFQAALENEF